MGTVGSGDRSGEDLGGENQSGGALRPTEADVELAVAQQRRLGDTGLRRARAGEDGCEGCRHYQDRDSALSYCWHPDHRSLVDATWWCRWFAPDLDR